LYFRFVTVGVDRNSRSCAGDECEAIAASATVAGLELDYQTALLASWLAYNKKTNAVWMLLAGPAW
jgi:hypothetical protein